MSYMLKLKTYLSPGIPREIYTHIINYLDKKLNITIELITETQSVGPDKNKKDPFSLNQVDIGHFHTPSYIWLTQKTPTPIELLPVGPIFDDPRTKNKPVYFIDIIVKKEASFKQFADLQGSAWTNCSPNIYNTLQKLSQIGHTQSFFTKTQLSHNHMTSLQSVLAHSSDATAIDSHVLALQSKFNKILAPQVKVIDSWGPYPMQPLIIRKGFDIYLKSDIIQALKQIHLDPEYGPKLANYLIKGFGDLTDQDFDESRKLLKIYENLSF